MFVIEMNGGDDAFHQVQQQDDEICPGRDGHGRSKA